MQAVQTECITDVRRQVSPEEQRDLIAQGHGNHCDCRVSFGDAGRTAGLTEKTEWLGAPRAVMNFGHALEKLALEGQALEAARRQQAEEANASEKSPTFRHPTVQDDDDENHVYLEMPGGLRMKTRRVSVEPRSLLHSRTSQSPKSPPVLNSAMEIRKSCEAPEDEDMLSASYDVDVDNDLFGDALLGKEKMQQALDSRAKSTDVDDRPPELPVEPRVPFRKPSSKGKERAAPQNILKASKTGTTNDTLNIGIIETGQPSHIDWLRSKGFAKPDDLRLYEYKGYQIHAPKIQLMRAKDWLTHSGADRTVNWERKFAELTEYLVFLKRNYNGEDWGYDLKEAMAMLRTHHIHDKMMEKVLRAKTKFAMMVNPKMDRLGKVDGAKEERVLRGYDPARIIKTIAKSGKEKNIVYQPARLRDIPTPGGVDPLAYTKASFWFNDQQRKWAGWVRDHAIKESWGHRDWEKREDHPMPLPPTANFMGPYVPDAMDAKMKKTWDTLKKYRSLKRKIKLCLDRSQDQRRSRPVLDSLWNAIEDGMEGKNWFNLHLFGEEHSTIMREGLNKIQPEEVGWIEFLCNAIPNVPKEDVELTPRTKVFLKEFDRVLNDNGPDGVFRDDGPQTLQSLFLPINRNSPHLTTQQGKSIIPHFTHGEIWEQCKILEKLGILRTAENEEVRCCDLAIPKHVPEEAIVWGPTPFLDTARELDEVMSDPDTVSTKISIPQSDVGPGRPAPAITLRSLGHVRKHPWDKSQQMKTLDFYTTLGYRFGRTLARLEKDHKDDLELLKEPKRRKANQKFMNDILGFWQDDYLKRPQNDKKNPAYQGERLIPLYRDIVKIAEPDQFDESWEGRSVYKGELQSVELVRQGIIREAHENKTPIWRRRAGIDEGDQEIIRKIPSWRREALWTFGHPSIRPKAPQFFNINRWPVHLQTEKRRAEIKITGPLLPPRSLYEENYDLSDEEMDSAYDSDEEFEGVPYKNDLLRRETVGKGGFWKGSTPRQKKYLINRIRKRFEHPKTPTWGEYLGSIVGRKRKRDDDPEDDHPQLSSPKALIKFEDEEKKKRHKKNDFGDESDVSLRDAGSTTEAPRYPWMYEVKKSWMRRGKGFEGSKVPLAIERVEPEEYRLDMSPGLVEYDKVLERFGV